MPWLGKTSMALGELICYICRLVKASKVKIGKRAEKKKRDKEVWRIQWGRTRKVHV